MAKLNIKGVAHSRGITLNTLAKRLDIHRQTLYQHCTGNPSADIICRIADAIGCSVGELFGEHSTDCRCPHCGHSIKIKLE